MSIFDDITLARVGFGGESAAHDYAWQGFQFHGSNEVIAASAKKTGGNPRQAGLVLGGLAVVVGLGYFVFKK